MDLPLRPVSSVDVARFSPRERVQQLTLKQIGDVPQFRDEIVDEEAPETASQDWLVQRTGRRALVDRVEAAKLPFGSEFLKGCVNSPALSTCPRILARRMSR